MAERIKVQAQKTVMPAETSHLTLFWEILLRNVQIEAGEDYGLQL